VIYVLAFDLTFVEQKAILFSEPALLKGYPLHHGSFIAGYMRHVQIQAMSD
jgi:hypothetical protein